MIETERLILRAPEPRDRAELHRMWADPRVMENLSPVKDAATSDADIARHDSYRPQGLGFWVVERRSDGAFLGFCGLKPGAANTPIEGEIEAGWMIDVPCWGQGYAQEAMRAAFAWVWANRPAERIVAMASARNAASQGLMRRLGMAHLPEMDFDHPEFAAGDPLRPMVIYAIDRP